MLYALECASLSKAFNGHTVLQDVSLNVRAGQLVTLLGPSGCGKTTTLRLIAGFEWPDSGTITLKGRAVAGNGARVPPEERRVGMVFQEYALFPHLNVHDNIAFGVQGSAKDKQQRVADMLALVGLDGLGKRMPYELSGGQQQRIALARALAPQPDLMLLDEPFSNLDAALRVQVRGEVRAILREAGITCVFVTHDQEEALSLSDEVAVMFEGRIAQAASPQQLYQRPASREVAAFIGESNFLPGAADGETAICALGRLALTDRMTGAVDLLIRPEALRLSPDSLHPEHVPARVVWSEFYGHDQRIGIALTDNTRLVARADADILYTAGQPVHVTAAAPVQPFPR